jgi:hypothetical protein
VMHGELSGPRPGQANCCFRAGQLVVARAEFVSTKKKRAVPFDAVERLKVSVRESLERATLQVDDSLVA